MNDLDRIAHVNALISANIRRLNDAKIMLVGSAIDESVAECEKELEVLVDEHDELLHSPVPYRLVIDITGGGKKELVVFDNMCEALTYFEEFAELCDPAKIERINAYTMKAVGHTLLLEKGE